MNLTWHIIQKDLRRLNGLLAIWAAGLYVLILAKGGPKPVPNSSWYYMILFVIFSCRLLSLSLIAWVVQEDGLTEGSTFWRTRPVTPGRLFAAKLTLLAALFIFLPLLAGICARFLGPEPETITFATWLGDAVGFFICMTLSAAALAACSKNLAQFLFAGFLCLIFGFIWMVRIQILAHASSPLTFRLQWISPTHLSELLCTALAVGVLFNQYFGRKLMISIGLILVALIVCPLILALAPGGTHVAVARTGNIQFEAMVVTKAEFQRHMSASVNDRLRPATYAELAALRGSAQPDYLVVRVLATGSGSWDGEGIAKIDGREPGYKFTTKTGVPKEWVEYLIPVDGAIYGDRKEAGNGPIVSENSPVVSVSWTSANQQ